MTAINTIVTAINNVLNNGDEDAAMDAISAGKRDALRGAFRALGGGSIKGKKAACLREFLMLTVGEHVNAWTDAQPADEPEAEVVPAPKKARKARGSKYTALLTQVMDEHGKDGVAVVTASVLLEMGFAKSTVVYHADWHHSLPCGKAAAALGIVGRLSTKGEGENTVTLAKIAV